MSTSVYNEITGNSYPGGKTYRRMLSEKKISRRAPVINALHRADLPGLYSLDTSERDVIQLYFAGGGDFIITDDGAAARYCRR